MGVFFAFLAVVGVFLVAGTAFDYYERHSMPRSTMDKAKMPVAMIRLTSVKITDGVDKGINNPSFHGDGDVGNGETDGKTVEEEKCDLKEKMAPAEKVPRNDAKSASRQRHPFVRFLLCFSMLTNGEKLLSLNGL